MKRTIGILLLSIWFILILVSLYYPTLLVVNLPFIPILRSTVFALRVLFGESNFVVVMVLLGLIPLPLALSKPMYPFFKNLLGIEFLIASLSTISYLNNVNKPIYIKGIVVEDLGKLLKNLVNNEILVNLTAYIVLILGLYLVITSYKIPKKLLAVVVSGLVNGISAVVIGVKNFLGSLKDQPQYEERYESPKYESQVANHDKEKKDKDFIEITVIDTGFPGRVTSDNGNSEEDTYKNYYSEDSKEDTYKDYYNDFGVKRSLPSEEKVIDTSVVGGEEEEEKVEEFEHDDVEELEIEEEPVEGGEDGKFSGKYPPPIDLLDPVEIDNISEADEVEEIEERKSVIEDTFAEFKISATIEGIIRGPVVTLYEIKPHPGTKISKIVSISDNLALNLATSRVRIVYPIPGKSVIGIEIPNKIRKIVKIRELITSREYRENKAKLSLVIGKDIHGKPIIEDLTQMPHLLIAGSTGSGKSVYVNSIITGLIYSRSPEELRFIMIDLKIVELKVYNGIPHLLTPVVTTPSAAKSVLEWLVDEMQDRYRKLEILSCRDITQYNAKVSKLEDETLEKLPHIVLIIDEYADLMMTSPKETEDYITRLAAMSRAVGIHLIIATQRPSVDVVTGLIKANFPARVAFRVASKVDSRTILDAIGAEKLLGKGDLLFMSPSNPNIVRVQGAYISNEEVERVVDYLLKQDSPRYIEIPTESPSQSDEEFAEGEEEEFSDELYHEAIKIVVMEKKASASYLQRRLRIGFNRAARMIDRMEEEGIVGPQQGVKPREILVDESFLERLGIY